MCNLYLMYYMDERHDAESLVCINVARRDLFKRLPSDNDTPLPRNPLLEEHAKHVFTSDNTIDDNTGSKRKGMIYEESQA